jgi:tetratricopeptide (TPR) repeat protein
MKLSKTAPRRLLLLALALACLVPAMPAAAQTPGSRAEALAALAKSTAAERRRGAMNLAVVGQMRDVPALIAALRDDDEAVREIAEQSVWAVWSRSGDAKVDGLFKRGLAEMNAGRLEAAVAIFTQVIELKPGFAEGWNKRATAYYLMGQYSKSLKDCDEVIRRNPRHFGALSGYGQIYLRLSRHDKALEYFRRALEINPNLDGVQELIDRLEAERAERLQKTI